MNYRNIERIVKGIANHRRVQILELLEKKPELSVFEISEEIKSEFKNVSVHIAKMAQAGLVMKRHEGSSVCHALTKRGKSILQFYRTLE